MHQPPNQLMSMPRNIQTHSNWNSQLQRPNILTASLYQNQTWKFVCIVRSIRIWLLVSGFPLKSVVKFLSNMKRCLRVDTSYGSNSKRHRSKSGNKQLETIAKIWKERNITCFEAPLVAPFPRDFLFWICSLVFTKSNGCIMQTSTNPADPPEIICKAACFNSDGFGFSAFFAVSLLILNRFPLSTEKAQVNVQSCFSFRLRSAANKHHEHMIYWQALQRW